MSDEGTAAAIAILRDFYPRADFPERTVAAYTEVLSDWPGDEVVRAVRRVIETSTFLPSVSEILREVAEGRLTLPTVEQAWDIASRGDLRGAAWEVRAAAEAVGGRVAILRSERPETVRAQFVRNYTGRREHSIRAELHGDPSPEVISLNARRLAELPVSTRINVRPIMAREGRRLAGRQLEPPTDEEKADAIAILREGPELLDEPERDPLYAAAERAFAEGGLERGA